MTAFETVQSAAAQHAACPICLDTLASQPGEVGALIYRGQRVEAALYHQNCVGVRARGIRARAWGAVIQTTGMEI